MYLDPHISWFPPPTHLFLARGLTMGSLSGLWQIVQPWHRAAAVPDMQKVLHSSGRDGIRSEQLCLGLWGQA